MLTDVITIQKPAPDSHFRLLPCGCGSDNVAYELYRSADRELWRVKCYDCGAVHAPDAPVRHVAQVGWNKRRWTV